MRALARRQVKPSKWPFVGGKRKMENRKWGKKKEGERKLGFQIVQPGGKQNARTTIKTE